ncbi:MAG TPA: hypothetical protein VFT72_02425 [Opitutaceae bacterium]|nr:hypothetical protein [Opitutaceae bacterium]
MAQSETKSVTPLSVIIDAVIVIAFFAFIYTVVAPHVPSNDKKDIAIWGGLGAACMTGVFWLALQMLKTVFRGQRAAKHR